VRLILCTNELHIIIYCSNLINNEKKHSRKQKVIKKETLVSYKSSFKIQGSLDSYNSRPKFLKSIIISEMSSC